jgi:endonuclease/exonuclease/phosphatase family metal-dependent hydrolase
MTPRKRLPIAALALGCALAIFSLPLALAGQEKQAPAVLRLGSWNLDRLGEPKARRGPGEGVEQKPADLAKYIRYARVDLLAVQEVTADSPAPEGFPTRYRTNSILTKTFEELNKTPGNGWKHILFPKMRAADTSQWTGIAWKSAKVRPVGNIFPVPVSHMRSAKDAPLWDRGVHAMMFSAGPGKTDFLVLVVHLKANTTGNFAEHRHEEVKELVAKLPRLAKEFPGEKDLVVLGDTNILAAAEPAVAELERAGFRDLNKADHDTHTAKGTQPFDRVFVPKDQPEFARSGFEVLSDFQKRERLSFADYRARFSDHYIVVTELRVMDDDD